MSEGRVRGIAKALSGRRVERVTLAPGERRAAVALILRESAGELEMLLIKRATYEGDPWSGHVALPGGRAEEGDASLRDTAVRETREETGIDLDLHGTLLGELDELHPRTPVLPPIIISPFAFALGGEARLVTSPEVAEAFWVPVDALRAPGVAEEIELMLATGPRKVTSLRHGPHTIWGLTERILRQFFSLLD
jgi:8-oxo-dGTP pyrophosphatase MutT (NUDIX family)